MPIIEVDWYPEELAAGKPPEKITISEWAAKYRILGRDSAMKGSLYSLEMTPFFIPIMNACQDFRVKSITIEAASQIGKTDAFLNIIGYYCHQEPRPSMVCFADQDTTEYIIKQRIQPMFEDSEILRKLIDQDLWTKKRVGLNNGAMVEMAWSSSVAQLGSKSMGIALADEIDKWIYYSTSTEAHPISLIEERLNTYPGAKFLKSSTPTDEFGAIQKEREKADICLDWHVPCPQCGKKQPLRWSEKYCFGFEGGKYRDEDGELSPIGSVVWEGGRKATREQILKTSRYKCGSCGALWNTIQKNEAVRQGRFVPRSAPIGYERNLYFHLPRLLSLFPGGRLEELVSKWVDIHRVESPDERRKELQGFINSTLAEPFKTVVVSTSKAEVLKARVPELEPRTAPSAAICLICGIDIQKTGFFYAVRAFAKNYTSWLIDYGGLASWEDVEYLLFQRQYPGGKAGKIWRCGIDVKGGIEIEEGLTSTDQAYFWIREHQFQGVEIYPMVGSSQKLAGKVAAGKILDHTPSGHQLKFGGLQLFLTDGDQCKTSFLDAIKRAQDGDAFQPAYLHNQVELDYVNQITAEEKRIVKGKYEWIQVGKNNHYLDCEVIIQALAAPEFPRGGVNMLWSPGQSGEGQKPQQQKKEKFRVPRPSSRMGGRSVNPWQR